MHPQIISEKPGTCPICGMDLVLFDKTNLSDNLTLNESQRVLKYFFAGIPGSTWLTRATYSLFNAKILLNKSTHASVSPTASYEAKKASVAKSSTMNAITFFKFFLLAIILFYLNYIRKDIHSAQKKQLYKINKILKMTVIIYIIQSQKIEKNTQI